MVHTYPLPSATRLAHLGPSIEGGGVKHTHAVILDENGDGETTKELGHTHGVQKGIVGPGADGHVHDLPERFEEAAEGRQLAGAVSLAGLVGVTEAMEAGRSRVDREKRVIHNVVLMGPTSENSGPFGSTGRDYDPGAMARAVPLFEGCQTFLNHTTESEIADRRGRRDVADFVGEPRGVSFDGEKLRAKEFHVLEGAGGDRILDMAERFPTQVAFSPDIEGHCSLQENGRLLFEDFKVVHSCDLVDRAGTTLTIFESAEGRKANELTISAGGFYAGESSQHPVKEDEAMTEAHTARVTEAEAGRDKALAAQKAAEEASVEDKRLREAAETAQKAAEKKVNVSDSIVHLEAGIRESKIPAPLAERIREEFKGQVCTREAVDQSIEKACQEFHRVNEAMGNSPVTGIPFGGPAPKSPAEGVAETGDRVRVAEGAFGRVIGVDMAEDKASK